MGFLIKPIKDGACLGFPGRGDLQSRGKIIVESSTDADWAGCKRTRRSRSSVQLYVGGCLVASMVRSQRSIAVSSGKSEFMALVGGSGKMIYLKERLECLAKDTVIVAGQGLGCGRIRHLDGGLPWVQDAVKRRRVFSVGPSLGHENLADVGTKPLAGSRLRTLLYEMGAVDEHQEPYGPTDTTISMMASLHQECQASDANPLFSFTTGRC